MLLRAVAARSTLHAGVDMAALGVSKKPYSQVSCVMFCEHGSGAGNGTGSVCCGNNLTYVILTTLAGIPTCAELSASFVRGVGRLGLARATAARATAGQMGESGRSTALAETAKAVVNSVLKDSVDFFQGSWTFQMANPFEGRLLGFFLAELATHFRIPSFWFYCHHNDAVERSCQSIYHVHLLTSAVHRQQGCAYLMAHNLPRQRGVCWAPQPTLLPLAVEWPDKTSF